MPAVVHGRFGPSGHSLKEQLVVARSVWVVPSCPRPLRPALLTTPTVPPRPSGRSLDLLATALPGWCSLAVPQNRAPGLSPRADIVDHISERQRDHPAADQVGCGRWRVRYGAPAAPTRCVQAARGFDCSCEASVPVAGSRLASRGDTPARTTSRVGTARSPEAGALCSSGHRPRRRKRTWRVLARPPARASARGRTGRTSSRAPEAAQ